MRWPWESDSKNDDDNNHSKTSQTITSIFGSSKDRNVSWSDKLNATNWHHELTQTAIASALLTGTSLFFIGLYKSWLRRVPNVDFIKPQQYRKRSLLGRVTSVGDGDNFRLYHTPGGRLMGWGLFRRVPSEKAQLRDRTIHIRLAGIDAPERAHFGRPAQPYSDAALHWLSNTILHRRVRAYIYRRDQYDRVVAQVFVRGGLLGLRRRDVGYEMLRRGLATVYEAKNEQYSEFGGRREEYEAVEKRAREKGVGMWGGGKEDAGWWERVKGLVGWTGRRAGVESPREYKRRMAREETEGKGKG
ncbi:SNase-domain-containing protein [Viridothelium virens]|uniref:Probable endonuclease LCL3 n=1 Tax=Viridothelium virens TaxID=1048519 RepID=A0A6A6HA92_VIRVR|nr:SNase-domain-containing protein [Viridothelium virens]